MRVLAISAHCDDAELGAGGFLQRFPQRHIVILSDGERGGDPGERRMEQIKSALVLNASTTFCHLPDTRIEVPRAIEVLEREIKIQQPDVVLTPAALDTHQDHRAVHAAALVACRDLKGTMLAYVGPSSAMTFRPTYFVPLSKDEMAVKVAALASHASQAGRPYASAEYVEGMGRYWAMVTRADAPFVEPFEVIRAWPGETA